ncbi:MAG: cobalamin B12-binding domain-containing protein [Planctomycetes bacterium]|nr:cobalamin B12-binding domain-containing protein [Planctomycetota bacterium]MBL7037894.1 cobalamin-dependent protein [Pirellulaceae bacterium]
MEPTTDSVYRRYLACLLKGDRTQCSEIVAELLEAKTDVKELYTGLFQRSMYEVGELWERHKISVAVEHLATAITESLLSLVYPAVFSAPHTNRSGVIACVANEYHQIGAKMVADLFELNGWHGYFLGANMPLGDLIRMIADKKPEMVGLSLAVYSNMPSLLKVLDAVTSASPEQRILVGGQAFRWGGSGALGEYSNTVYVSSLSELEALLREA